MSDSGFSPIGFGYVRSWLEIVQVMFMLEQVKVEGLNNIPTEGPYMLMSTLNSPLDPLLLMLSVQRPYFSMMPPVLSKRAFVGLALRLSGAIRCNRRGPGAKALEMAEKTLNKGEGVLCFPEEEQSEGNGRIASKYFIPAIETGTSILPVTIVASQKAMGMKSKFPRPSDMEVRIGRPIRVPLKREPSRIELDELIHEYKRRQKDMQPLNRS